MLKFKVAFDKVRYQPKFFLVILFLKRGSFSHLVHSGHPDALALHSKDGSSTTDKHNSKGLELL